MFSPAGEFFRPSMQLGSNESGGGRACTVILGKDKKIDNLNYELNIHACAKCGNCMAECPAYLVTKERSLYCERENCPGQETTGRAESDSGRGKCGLYVHALQSLRRDMSD